MEYLRLIDKSVSSVLLPCIVLSTIEMHKIETKHKCAQYGQKKYLKTDLTFSSI